MTQILQLENSQDNPFITLHLSERALNALYNLLEREEEVYGFSAPQLEAFKAIKAVKNARA